MIRIASIILALVLVYLAVGEEVTPLFRRRAEIYREKYGHYLTRAILAPALVFVVLAVLMRDIVLTPFLLAVAVGVAYFRIQQVRAEIGTITPRQVSQLVIAFRGAYQLQPAAFASLEEAATKVGEPLSSLIERMVDVYFATSDPERAYADFRRRTDSMLLNQFMYILEMSESASDESVTEALDAFVIRLRRQEELQRQIETGLASITGQTGFIQILAVAIAFVVALIPGFRQVYAGGFWGRIGYMFLVAVILGASYMIENNILQLKEQVL